MIEIPEKEEYEGLTPSDCKCISVINESLNLNFETPFMIKWKGESSNLYTTSMYNIPWSHQGHNIVNVTLRTKKDDIIKVDSQIYIIMQIKNLSTRILNLICLCDE